jgi:hypothetical protein
VGFAFLDKLPHTLTTFRATYASAFASDFTVEFFAMCLRSPQATSATSFRYGHLASAFILQHFTSKKLEKSFFKSKK